MSKQNADNFQYTHFRVQIKFMVLDCLIKSVIFQNLRYFLGKEYLKIDSNGDLRTARKIDREKICSKRIETCILTSEVIITPREYFKLFKGKGPPLFLSSNITRFYEKCAVKPVVSRKYMVKTL